MSLSTQLTRGTLALPMLALFGVLALLAGRAAEAEALVPKELAVPAIEAEIPVRELKIEAGRELVLEARSADIACGAHSRPQLLLAQAPADLGRLAQRQVGACRAAG